MNVCIRHPDREARFTCMKTGVYLCDECARCQDPEGYCKFRQGCMIQELERERRRERRKAGRG